MATDRIHTAVAAAAHGKVWWHRAPLLIPLAWIFSRHVREEEYSSIFSGINLAIQDAVATANLLAVPLRSGTLTSDLLHRVQRRREMPTRLTQSLQVFLQNRIIRPVLGGRKPLSPPWPARMLDRFPTLRRVPARLIGMGFRPEHVRTEDAFAGSGRGSANAGNQ